ncbi:MAG TPA: hypothetical protein VGM91_01520 [Conexibacter sp.]|jgi:prepilin-type processing-associated H-X9-DG protein
MSFFDDLEHDLVGAAARRRDARRVARVARLRQRIGLRRSTTAPAPAPAAPPRTRIDPRRIALATVLFLLVGSATAGAALYALRGSVIPGPPARDVPADQLPAPGTARMASVIADDPVVGRPPWTLRIARSSTGLLCSAVGQLDHGRFGLVGLDGRFRVYSAQVVDSCGQQLHGDRPSLIGARVFDADDPHEVRTIVNGVGGSGLRSVTVVLLGRAHAIPVGPGGTFVAAVAGYPEDTALAVELRYADGHVERNGFGRSPWVVPDPSGGQAWKLAAGMSGTDLRSCVSFSPARGMGAAPRSPSACGLIRSFHHPDDYFFAVRRIEPGTGGTGSSLFDNDGDWGDAPARTAIWGSANRGIRQLQVTGPGVERTIVPNRGRTFLAVFPPTVDPATLTVAVVFADGHVERHSGDANLLDRKVPRR